MTDRPQLKYIRTTQGFTVFPCLSAKHDEISRATPWPLLSAGFVEWDFDGLPLCMGRSESLNLNSMSCDTAALRAEWGMRPAAAPVTLTPAMLADAEAIGACCDPMSLEPSEPAL